MSLWICNDHGLTGPTGCCAKAERVTDIGAAAVSEQSLKQDFMITRFQRHAKDVSTLRVAIEITTGGNRSAFGRALGHSDGSRIHAWLRSARQIPPHVVILCRAIQAHPKMAVWLCAASAREFPR